MELAESVIGGSTTAEVPRCDYALSVLMRLFPQNFIMARLIYFSKHLAVVI